MDFQKCLCPDCKTGSINELRGKYGKFYACSDNNCNWKVSPKKMSELIKNGTIRELTHEELIILLTSQKPA